MIAIELADSAGEPDAVATGEIAKACHAEGLVPTAGTYGNVLCFVPPLVMPPDLLRDALGVLGKVLSELRD